MDQLVCHFPIKGGVEDRIAQTLGKGYTMQGIANLMGMYDTQNETPLVKEGYNPSDAEIAQYAQKLMTWNNTRAKKAINELKDTTKHMGKTFAQLFKVPGWGVNTRRNRINMIVLEFSNEVSKRFKDAATSGIPISREQIVNGYQSLGEFREGQFSIFDAVFFKLWDDYNDARRVINENPPEYIDEVVNAINAAIKEAEQIKDEDERNSQIKELKDERDGLLEDINAAMNKVEEYPKIFNNWAALCAFARMSLRDVEGLKLGNTLEYAAPTRADDFVLEPLEESYNLEESVFEAWQQQHEKMSSFGSLGAEVRRFLATIQDVDEDGHPKEDELGYKIMMDPVVLHSHLQDVLRGITSESRMLKRLKEVGEYDPQVKSVYEALGNAAQAEVKNGKWDNESTRNGVIITQFLLDIHKNTVPYSALKWSAIHGYYIQMLNKRENPLESEFRMRMFVNKQASKDKSVYNEDGSINWENLGSWYAQSQLYLPSKEKKEKEINVDNVLESANTYAGANAGTGFYSLRKHQKIEYIIQASRQIGLPISTSAARRIVSNKKTLNTYLKQLREYREYLTRPSAWTDKVKENFNTIVKYEGRRPIPDSGFTKKDQEEYDAALEALNKLKWRYESVIDLTVGKNSKKGIVYERLGKALDVINDVSGSLKYERRASWYDRKGKVNSRFVDRTPSYMGDLVDKIHDFVEDQDGKGLREFIMEKWGHSTFFYDPVQGRFLNKWLQELYDSIEEDGTVKADALAYVFAFDQFLGSDMDGQVSIFENFTEKQHAESMIKQFIQPRHNSPTSVLAKYPSFILGDSGVQMFFTAKHYTTEEILNGLKDVFKQEKERAKYADATNKMLLKFFADQYHYDYAEENGKPVVKDAEGKVLSEEALKKLGYRPVENYTKTGNEFTMLKFLNKDFKKGKYWKILTGNTEKSDAELGRISKQKAFDMAIDAINSDSLEDAIKEYMKDSLADFKEKLVSLEILTRAGKDAEGNPIYTERKKKGKGFFSNNLELYKNKSLDAMLEDFFWNTKYATIQQLQMFTVDPAFYDYRYPIKDLQKRYKEIYAPGKGISIEARDFNGNLYTTKSYETAVYFDDVAENSETANPEFAKAILRTYAIKDVATVEAAIKEGVCTPLEDEGQEKKRQEKLYDLLGTNYHIYHAYTNNTLTDGQGYRTLKSYRAVKGMAGEWTRAMEAAYNRINEIRSAERELTKEDLQELASLAVILQPIKPYLFTLEQVSVNDETGDRALIPVQHKYAEVVLIPELMQDGKLKEMARWMEREDVDLLASTKCVKVGAFGSAMIKEASDIDSINASLNKAWKHKLSWSDYRIQSGVPEHLNHAQLYGTQIRKLILSNIKKDASYKQYLTNILMQNTDDPDGLTVYIPGMGNVHLTGANLISFYNSLIMTNLFDSYENLENQVSTNKALSDKLLQSIISNSRQSEDNAFGFSLIDEGPFEGEFVIPPSEPGMEHDAIGNFLSWLRSNVNKQKILGGSFVQASALGLSGFENSGDLFEVVDPEDGDNVLYDELEMPFNRSFTTSRGDVVQLKFEDWCTPDGNLLLCDGGVNEDGSIRPKRIVYGREAREYLSWPVSGRRSDGRPNEIGEDGYDPNGYYVPLIENSYKGILDMILYRIPTEKEYSMINGKVFRFTHPTAGGTGKVPLSRTTTAGFDFDIDKLYFFMREFAQKPMSNEEIDEIWKEIYKNIPEFHKALQAARADTFLNSIDEDEYWEKFESYVKAGTADLNELRERMEAVEKRDEKQIRDYHFWSKVKENDTDGRFANIPASPSDAFTQYMETHRKDYPFDVYDPSKPPTNPITKKGKVIQEGNSRIARNNMLIDLIRQRLMDKETMKARYTPGGFDNNREAALRMRVLQFAPLEEISKDGHIDMSEGGLVDQYIEDIREGKKIDPEPEYDVSDPTAILVYNQQNQVAGKLIGIFANQNTNHVYASTMHAFGITNPIAFGNHANNGLSDLIGHPEGVDVDTNMAEYLAASVDAVKDPVLNFLNLNLITADSASLLARLGYTPMEIGLLFNQPIIKRVCDYAANNNVSTDAAIAQVLKEYQVNGKTLTMRDVDLEPSVFLTADKLTDYLLEDRKVKEGTNKEHSTQFVRSQLQVLKLFNEILATSADLNSFVQATRFTAANSIGSTWGDIFAQEMRVADFIDKYKEQAKKDKDRASLEIYSGVYGKKRNTDEKDTRRLYFELFDPNMVRKDDVSLGKGKTGKDEDINFDETTEGILDTDEGLIKLNSQEYIKKMSRNPLAFEQCMMDLTRKAVRKLFGRHFPYFNTTYKTVRDKMARLTKYGNLDADTINSIHRDLMVYMLTKQEGSDFDGEAWSGIYDPYSKKMLTNREYYTTVFPVLLSQLKESGALKNMPFFNLLSISDFENNTTIPNIIISGIGGLQSSSSNMITEMWADAFESDEEIDTGNPNMKMTSKDLARAFYFYNYYKLGYNFHPTSSMHLAPTLLKLGLKIMTNDIGNNTKGYIDFIRGITDGSIFLDDEGIDYFIKQYIANHLDNTRFVLNLKSGTAFDFISKKVGIDNGRNDNWSSSFEISLSELKKEGIESLFIAKDKTLRGELVAFRPVIAVENGNGEVRYYMADNSTVGASERGFNVASSANGTMKFKELPVQGERGKRLRYFNNNAYKNFQGENSLRAYNESRRLELAEQGERAGEKEANTDKEGGAKSQTPIPTIKIGTVINNMFTNEEWQQMFDKFKETYGNYFEWEWVQDLSTFKSTMMDTSDQSNVDVLNDLAKDLSRSKMGDKGPEKANKDNIFSQEEWEKMFDTFKTMDLSTSIEDYADREIVKHLQDKTTDIESFKSIFTESNLKENNYVTRLLKVLQDSMDSTKTNKGNSDRADGAPIEGAGPEVGPIVYTPGVEGMFTDAEWNRLFEGFKQLSLDVYSKNSSGYRNLRYAKATIANVEAFKRMFTTEAMDRNSSLADIFKKIQEKLNNNELTTESEEGEVPVCPLP